MTPSGNKWILPAVTTRRVDGSFLTAHHKVIDVSREEGEAGHGYSLGLFVLQLHGVLRNKA